MVGRSESNCNACGRSCDPCAKTHDRILGYGPENGTLGCGIGWTHICSKYSGELAERLTREMRPDLEFVNPFIKTDE
jgi:hypothetical protein